MPKLTKAVVDGAASRAKQYTVWCSDLKGFGVYIQPTGGALISSTIGLPTAGADE